MTDQTNNAALLSPAEMEYACQAMLNVNGAVGLYTTPERQPLLLAEIAAWLLAAGIFLALRDNYKGGNRLSDADLDAAIEDMKKFVPERADHILASIQLGRDQTPPPPSPQHPSAAVN